MGHVPAGRLGDPGDMNYDLLLEWTSERGAGSLSDFKTAHDWLNLGSDGSTWRPKATTTALVLASLGHIEVDWTGRSWAATSPMLTILPSAGGHALLTGGRTRVLLGRMWEAAEVTGEIYVFTEPQEGPSAVFVAADDETAVEDLAKRLEIDYDFCVAERLSRVIPSLNSTITSLNDSTPARGFGVWRLEILSDGDESWREVTSDARPGLYKYDVWGRAEFRWVDDAGRHLPIDKFSGIYAELHRLSRQCLRLVLDGTNGELVVPAGAPLPALHARAAVLCSGLAPYLDRASRTRRYPNVPPRIAERIGRSLGQQVETTGMPATPAGPRPIPFLKVAGPGERGSSARRRKR